MTQKLWGRGCGSVAVIVHMTDCGLSPAPSIRPGWPHTAGAQQTGREHLSLRGAGPRL